MILTYFFYFYRCTVHSVVYLISHTNTHTHTHTHTYTYILFKKSKIYIKTFETFLHVSITQSSSGSIHCSLLKLQLKTFSELLHYVNFSAVAACRVLCVSHALFRMSLVMVVCCMLCSVRLSLTLQSIRRTTITSQSHATQHTTHNHNQAHS